MTSPQEKIAESVMAESFVSDGKRRYPLKVITPPDCPHLSRGGPIQRTLTCKFASRHLNATVYTSGLRCRHECPAHGGPQGGKEITGKQPRELLLFMRSSMEPTQQSETLKGKKAWKESRPLWVKALEFTRAVSSGRDIDENTYKERHISCHGKTPDGEYISPPCSYRRPSERNGFFCSVCGCGDKKLANLSPDPATGKSKLQFVELTCPMKKKGFTNASDPS